jgi:protease I
MKHSLTAKKVAILTENGFEESELTSPKKAMEDAGIEVQIVSPQKDKVKAWNHDHWSIELRVDVNLADAKEDDYDALMIPGRRDESRRDAHQSCMRGICKKLFRSR